MELAITISFIGGLVFLGYFLSFVFDKTSVPEILPLFCIGLVLGPITGIIDPTFFGGLGTVFATLVLLLILFEGGLAIKLPELIRSFPSALAISILTFLTTIFIVAPLAYIFFGIPLLTGSIIGIIVAGTSTAVILSLVRTLKLSSLSQTLMSVESNLNDILTVVLAFGLFEFITAGAVVNLGDVAQELLWSILGSLAVGIASAYIWSLIVRRIRRVQHNIFMTPAFLLLLFGLTELFGGNGFLSAFTFAITLGNLDEVYDFFRQLKNKKSDSEEASTPPVFTFEENRFFSAAAFTFKTFFFVYMGILINVSNMSFLIWGAGVMVLLFFARMLLVRLLFSKKLPRRDAILAGGLSPKGVAGIAILAILGDKLLQDMSYPIILFSIIYTSIFVFFARRSLTTPDSAEPSDSNSSASQKEAPIPQTNL